MPHKRKKRKKPSTPRLKLHSDEKIIEAIQEAKGSVYIAARLAGCTPRAIYDRIKSSELVRDAVANERGITGDVAETVVYKNMLGSDPYLAQRAAEYHLNTIGKSRGYTTRTEIDVREAKRLVLIEEIVDADLGENPPNDPPPPE